VGWHGINFRAAALSLLAVRLSLCDSPAEAFHARRFEDAVRLSDSVLKTHPQDAGIWTLRGRALAALGRETESVSSFAKALQIAPKFVPALEGAVEVAYRAHDARAAIFVDSLLRVQPENGVAHAVAGVLAFEAHDCNSAVRHFERAREQVSRNDQAYSLYGACLTNLRRFSDAVPVFQQLVAHQPDNPDMRFDLGYVQLLAGEPAEAAITLQRFPGQPNADTLNLLSAVEVALGKSEAAVSHLYQAIGVDPLDEPNYVDLAALLVQNGSIERAGDIVEAGLKRLPKSARLHSLRGVVRAQLGTFEEAAAEFDLANRLDPGLGVGAAGLGVLYTDANRADLAASILRERLKKEPNNATMNYLLADALMKESAELGTPPPEEVRKALAIAIKARPDFAKAHTLLGKLYSLSGNYSQAVEELKLGARYDPADRTALSQLAIALRRSGRREEAEAASAKLRRLVMKQLAPEADLHRIRVPSP
jgi:Flp pilus assembly protein TadD